jgi:zinc transport system substrate-binding protein
VSKRPHLFAATLATSVCLSALPAMATEGVVASIKPVHSLVAAVMEGVGTPQLLVKGAGSPHTYALRPSEAQALEQARLVFRIGNDLEVFLTRPLETLGSKATIVNLSDAHDAVRLDVREGGSFEAHRHDDQDEKHSHDHDHAHEGEHDHDEGHDHDGHDHGKHDHDHDAHAHHGIDMHMWLDPVNAKAFVHEIEEALAKIDPANAAAYGANAAKLSEKLDALVIETNAALASVRGKTFVVFHDAYQYFEHRFDFAAAGAITVNPEVMPGAQRLTEIRDRVKELGAACIFAEPQFEPRLISVVAEGTDARSGVLDPLGAELEDGPELYFDLIRGLTTSLTTCLSGTANNP